MSFVEAFLFDLPELLHRKIATGGNCNDSWGPSQDRQRRAFG